MGVILERKKRILMAQDQFVPPGYQKYDYLETPYNAEGYSYINTGIAGNNNNLKFVFNYMALERRGYGRILGSWSSESTACWRLIQSSNTTTTRYYIYTANSRRASSSTSIAIGENGTSIIGTKASFELEYGKCKTNYGANTESADGSTVSTNNFSIGTRYAGDTSNGCAKGRFYDYFRIFDNGKLIRNYIPVVRKSDNKAGFYDTVNHTFNPSIGTVDFTAGNDQ